MTSSERKRLEALELAKIEQENFENWVQTWRSKYFDLTKPKEEVLWDICKTFANGEVPSAEAMVKMVFMSYYRKDKKSIEQFEDHANLKIKNIKKLFENFLFDVTGERCENFIYSQVVDTLAKHTCDLLIKTFGNAVYVDFKPTNFSNMFKISMIKQLTERGFVDSVYGTNIFINPNHPYNDFKSSHQEWLKETYSNLLKNYSIAFPTYDKTRLKSEEFEQVCNLFDAFLMEIKKHMTQETLNNPQMLEAKKLEEKLTNSYLSNKKCKFPQEKEYYKPILESVKKLNLGEANENDKKVFAEFMERCKVLKKAISIVDKNGDPYCTHYFVFMPISTRYFGRLLNKVESCKALDGDTKKFICQLKAQLTNLFHNNFNLRLQNGKAEFEDVLFSFRDLKSKNSQSEVDLYNKDTFNKFINKAEEIVKTYNLPKSEECYRAINMDLIRGRNPINLGSLDPVKKEKVK